MLAGISLFTFGVGENGKADILGLGQTGSYDRCDIVGYQSLCAHVDKYSRAPVFMGMQHT